MRSDQVGNCKCHSAAARGNSGRNRGVYPWSALTRIERYNERLRMRRFPRADRQAAAHRAGKQRERDGASHGQDNRCCCYSVVIINCCYGNGFSTLCCASPTGDPKSTIISGILMVVNGFIMSEADRRHQACATFVTGLDQNNFPLFRQACRVPENDKQK